METSAQLTVAHAPLEPDSMRQLLERHFSCSTEETSKAAELANYPQQYAKRIVAGCQQDERILLFLHQTLTTLQVTAIPRKSGPYQVAQSAWEETREALKAHKPKCTYAGVVGKDRENYAIGSLGFWEPFKDIARVVPVLVAIASLVIVLVGKSDPAVQIPAFITGLVSLAYILWDVSIRKIRWHIPKG